MELQETPWWQKSVIYQIAVRSFADSNGDGEGDLRGIIERLDYLNDGTSDSLGVDAIWLTPVNASPMADFGYDVSDYLSINPAFGTMDEFDELLAECHRRGIRVIMDMVLNHTSAEHPWFTESRSSRDNPKRDWYIWRDGRKPGKPPNRWRAVVEGSAWVLDESTGQYYYHAFLPEQPDLNWRNPEVREALFDACRFWLDKGVDGFRLDLINFLYEDEELRDNPRKFGLRTYEWQKHVHDRSLPESMEAARELRRLTDAYEERMMMGEVYTDTPEESVGFLGDGTDALHLSFYLDFATRKWSPFRFRNSVDRLERMMPENGWPCYYLSNHDLVRHYTRLGSSGYEDGRAKVAAAMLLTLRGTPILYYGEEIGMPQSRVRKKDLDDPIGKKWWPIPVGRDGSRTPMQWSDSDHAGFTAAEPWLRVDPSYTATNVERQQGDPCSLLSWYRRLTRVRKEKPALQSGDYVPVDRVPGDIFAYIRRLDDERIAVILNFSSLRTAVRKFPDVLGGGRWRVLLSTHGREGEELKGKNIEIEPDQVLILEAL